MPKLALKPSKRPSDTELDVHNARGASLGFPHLSPASMSEKINAGFSVTLLDKFAKASALPLETVVEIIRIPSRTLSRRRAQGRLHPDESERLLRLSTVFEKTLALFEGDKNAAVNWLRTPQPALGGMHPLDLAKTEIGAREVEDLIGRLEHGVFT
jgi:putative toxin-antitoxin system antitoxin component (TIGR02293 family)